MPQNSNSDVFVTLTKSELASRYRRDWRTINKLLDKAGIKIDKNAKTLLPDMVRRCVEVLGSW